MAAALIVLTVVFNFLSGILDSSNIVAMPISSRAMPPRVALLLAAACAFVSPYVFGVAVARTIGQGLFGADVVPAEVIVAGLASAIVWTSRHVACWPAFFIIACAHRRPCGGNSDF